MARKMEGSKARGAKAVERRTMSKTTAKAKPAPKAGKARVSTKARGKKPAAKAKAAMTSPAAARPRVAAGAPKRRRILPRHQPETLRCKSMSISLTADDLERSVRFYVDGLGFHLENRWERDGKLLGVEMVAGRCMIGLSQDDWAKGRNREKGVGLRIYLDSSQDVDEVARRIKGRGVEVDGPKDSPWGARVAHVTDPDGFQLTLMQEKKG